MTVGDNLARGDAAKLIGEGSDQFPVWTRDGKRVVYRATRAGTRKCSGGWRTAVEPKSNLTTGKGIDAPGSWSPKGRRPALYGDGHARARDILSLKLVDRRDGTVCGETRFCEAAPEFSPDGRWVAYVSERIRASRDLRLAVPGSGPKVADFDRRRDGAGLESKRSRALLSKWKQNDGRGHNHTTGLRGRVNPENSLPETTCRLPRWVRNYDVSPDGRRFLMIQPTAGEHAAPTQIIVVLNWHEELKRLVPTK